MVVTGYEFLKRCQPDEISPGIRSVDLTSRIDYYGHLKNYKKKKKRKMFLKKNRKRKFRKGKNPRFSGNFLPPRIAYIKLLIPIPSPRVMERNHMKYGVLKKTSGCWG